MNRRRAGFTLIEVVVALGVMVLIASLAWGVLAGTFKARDFLERQSRLEKSARVALDRIDRELSVAFLTSHTTAVNTYRTVFIGRDEDDADVIWFATRAHRRRYANAHECDQAEITLWTDTDPEDDSGRRLVLLHRESQRIDEKPDEDGVILPLATGVTRFDLRYLDPKTAEWRDEWDSTGTDTPDRLPRAVEVVLTLVGPDAADPDEDVERTFVRTILLVAADAMQRSLLNSGQRALGDDLGGGIPTR